TGNGVTVTVTGNTALCPGESTTLTASGASSYLWSTGELSPSIIVSSIGTYSVTGSNACGSSTESVTVSLGVAPSVSITGTSQICAGRPATLTATANGALFWNTGATTPSITVTAAGTYSATATNACGSSSASFTVTESPGPTVSITGVLSICDGASTTLTASGADTYGWSTGASGSTITVSTPGPITVTGTNACGSDEATVTVGQSPAPTVTVSGGGTLCPGEQLLLTATSNATVSWNTGATTTSLTVSAPGLYVATATNACGTDSDAQQVTASPLTASFTASSTIGTAPLTVQFNNTSAQASTSTWDLGGEATSTAVSPSFTFTEPGIYLVTLVTTADDCVAEADLSITVTEPGPGTTSLISIPNVFTPNGDRVNDVLVMQAVNIVSVEVFIYNRWGQKVNELKRVGEVWDARSMSGNLVPDGTYFYTLTAQGSDGITHDLSGHITVVR
ncbi:MAG: gliding motility-associated C-terminal domain-containing protein, partial [Flavobacteriales bacterium]